MASKLTEYKAEIDQSPAQPQASTTQKPRSTGAQTVSQDPGHQSVSGLNGESSNFLNSLLQATIFFNYFEHVAQKTYTGIRSDLKVLKLKTAHPSFHKSCIIADWFVRMLAFLALFVFAAWSAYKVTAT